MCSSDLVQSGFLADKILRQLEYFLCFIQKQRPFVTLKTALSLDGKYAASDGSSRWISNEASRKYTHKLRSENDAILCGVKTILIDNPLLNVRLKGKHRQPLRIVLDPALEIPLDSAFIASLADFPGMVVCEQSMADSAKCAELKLSGAKVLGLPTQSGLFNLAELLHQLALLNISSLLLETGSGVAESFFKAGLVDKCLFFYGAKIVGGDKSPLPGLGLDNIIDAISLKDLSFKRFGDNIMISAYPQY